MVSTDSLRQSSLFDEFDDETLARLAEPFHEVNFPADQILIEARTAGAGLFVICDGTVEVEAHDIRRTLGAGEVVGEISLVEEGTRRARVVTTSPVRALALGRADFDQLVENEPRFGEAVRELARRRLADLQS
jgi:CRP/FNR family transcriptional regulator, cyclic AMP receptor protein